MAFLRFRFRTPVLRFPQSVDNGQLRSSISTDVTAHDGLFQTLNPVWMAAFSLLHRAPILLRILCVGRALGRSSGF